MQHIHVNWRGNSPTARGNSPWGVASITHIVCDRHRRRRGAGLLLASLAQPRPKILTPKSLPGSMRATTPSVVVWAPVTPSARDSSSKDGASARAVGNLGRYDYWGSPNRVRAPENFLRSKPGRPEALVCRLAVSRAFRDRASLVYHRRKLSRSSYPMTASLRGSRGICARGFLVFSSREN
jgi:hypothetical protein